MTPPRKLDFFRLVRSIYLIKAFLSNVHNLMPKETTCYETSFFKKRLLQSTISNSHLAGDHYV